MCLMSYVNNKGADQTAHPRGERGGSVVECRTPEREVRGSRPTAAVLCPWARHFTPRKYWLITQEAMAPSRHDWKIVDWDVKPQHNQPTKAHPRSLISAFVVHCLDSVMSLVSVAEISSLMLSSVAEQAGLSLAWSETPEDTFCRVVAQLIVLRCLTRTFYG